MNVVIGGCVYRSMVHTAHMMSVLDFVEALRGEADGVVLDYQHTSNLPQGRSLWLRRAIDRQIPGIAVTVDSDTSFSADSLFLELLAINRDCDWAIAVAPVIRNNRPLGLNVFHARGEPLAPSVCGGGRPSLWAGGFGLAAFNLQWFRQHWTPYPEPFGDSGDWINQGEDIQMCRSVVKRRGTIVPMWVPTTHYDCAGGSVVGASIRYRGGRMVADE